MLTSQPDRQLVTLADIIRMILRWRAITAFRSTANIGAGNEPANCWKRKRPRRMAKLRRASRELESHGLIRTELFSMWTNNELLNSACFKAGADVSAN